MSNEKKDYLPTSKPHFFYLETFIGEHADVLFKNYQMEKR